MKVDTNPYLTLGARDVVAAKLERPQPHKAVATQPSTNNVQTAHKRADTVSVSQGVDGLRAVSNERPRASHAKLKALSQAVAADSLPIDVDALAEAILKEDVLP